MEWARSIKQGRQLRSMSSSLISLRKVPGRVPSVGMIITAHSRAGKRAMQPVSSSATPPASRAIASQRTCHNKGQLTALAAQGQLPPHRKSSCPPQCRPAGRWEQVSSAGVGQTRHPCGVAVIAGTLGHLRVQPLE